MTIPCVTTEDVRGWAALFPAHRADDALGISHSTGRNLRLAGSYPLPVLLIGRLNKVRRSDLLQYLEPAKVASFTSGAGS